MSCTLCVMTIGGGLLIARKLGINEYIVAVWMSGFNTAIAFYMSSVIRNRILGSPILLAIIFYLTSYLYLRYTDQMNDAVFLGMTAGGGAFFAAHFLEAILRKNKGKSSFPFQRVIIPILFLTLASLSAAVKAF